MIAVTTTGKIGASNPAWPFDRIAGAIATAILADESVGPAIKGGGEARATLQAASGEAGPSFALLAYDADGAMKIGHAATYRAANAILRSARYLPPREGTVIAVEAPRSATLRAASAAHPTYDATQGRRDFARALEGRA